MHGKILLILLSHLNLKKKDFFQRKEYFWIPISTVWPQKGHMLQMNRIRWSSNLILTISHFLFCYELP